MSLSAHQVIATYVLDVLWCQPIKLIQERHWFYFFLPLHLVQGLRSLKHRVNTVRSMVFCSSQMLETFLSHVSKTRDLKISLAWVMNKTPYSYIRAHSICIVVKYKQTKFFIKYHTWLQKSIISHVTTLTFFLQM